MGYKKLTLEFLNLNTELLSQNTGTAACNNIPGNKITNEVYSIRTDACFIAYWARDCKSIRTMKYMPGDYHVSSLELVTLNVF